MDAALAIAGLYALYAVPLLLGALLVWLAARRRFLLRWPDVLLLAFPPAVWLVLLFVNDLDKSMSNLVEPLFLGALAALAFAARVVVAVRAPLKEALASRAALLACCAAAVAIWALVPGLPE